MEASPTIRRRRLGHILRGLRERAGLTGEEVAARLERSGSWVSRVEMGRVGLRGRDLRELLAVYEVADQEVAQELVALAREGKQRGWWSKFADALSTPYATYIGFEAAAAELLVYDTFVVSGLLQTPAYARALFAAGVPGQSGELIERKIEVRLARQALLHRPQPVALRVVLDESVLYRSMGRREVLRGQLDHLLTMTKLPNVSLQVLPYDAGAIPGMVGSFTLVRFPSPDDPDLVYIEGASGDIFEESDDAQRYREVFDHLQGAALDPAMSSEHIRRVRDGAA